MIFISFVKFTRNSFNLFSHRMLGIIICFKNMMMACLTFSYVSLYQQLSFVLVLIL